MTLQNATLMTAEEFASLDESEPVELVRGRIIYLTKPKPKHGRIAMRVGAAVAAFVQQHGLGEVYAAETGFIAGRDPDSVRAPDVAFVRSELAAVHDEDEWFPQAPDLAVEVISPNDGAKAIRDKVQCGSVLAADPFGWLIPWHARSSCIEPTERKLRSVCMRCCGTIRCFRDSACR